MDVTNGCTTWSRYSIITTSSSYTSFTDDNTSLTSTHSSLAISSQCVSNNTLSQCRRSFSTPEPLALFDHLIINLTYTYISCNENRIGSRKRSTSPHSNREHTQAQSNQNFALILVQFTWYNNR